MTMKYILTAVSMSVLALAGACSNGQDGSERPDSSCVARISFGDRTYVEHDQANATDPPKGRRLGSARAAGCGDPETDAADDEFAVYEAVGFDPSDAVIVEPGYGLVMAQ
jgi:hypothetical protein